MKLWRATELDDRLATAGERRCPSLLNDEPLLLLDAREGMPAADVRDLPCVTVAVGGTPEAAADFDVHLKDEAGVEALAAPIRQQPQAALTLVHQLRLAERLSVTDGLRSESLAYGMLQGSAAHAAWLEGHGPRVTDASSDGRVRVERVGHLLRVMLDRPLKRNAFNDALRDGLCEALEVALSEPDLRVELSGVGPAFCSGADLASFGLRPDPATGHAVRSTRHVGRLLGALANRTTVHVHGACIGAGVELPAFAGRVTASHDAYFQLPELAMGLIPGAGGTVSLMRRMGRQRTAWMALTGVLVDVHRALAWGLIDDIPQTTRRLSLQRPL